MPDLSIKDVPAQELEQLRARAKRHHRSLQGELRTILSEALAPPEQRSPQHRLSFDQVLAELRKIPLQMPRESARMIREDRDGR